MSGRSLACIIGWPVEHSLSPAIHNAAFRETGLDWTYMAVAVRPGAIEEGVDLLHTLGAAGANVTAPHKQTIMPHLDAVDDEAAAIGAVNTLVRDKDGFLGSNTDGRGFVRFLAEDVGADPAGLRALVLGGGGAARGVAFAMASAGASIAVWARDPDQSAAIAALHPSIEQTVRPAGERVDLLVQATPIEDDLPADLPPLDEQVVAVDLIYGKQTAFLSAARAAGARTFDGLGMLVHQAALSFEVWTGVAAPVDVMRRAARGAVDGS